MPDLNFRLAFQANTAPLTQSANAVNSNAKAWNNYLSSLSKGGSIVAAATANVQQLATAQTTAAAATAKVNTASTSLVGSVTQLNNAFKSAVSTSVNLGTTLGGALASGASAAAAALTRVASAASSAIRGSFNTAIGAGGRLASSLTGVARGVAGVAVGFATLAGLATTGFFLNALKSATQFQEEMGIIDTILRSKTPTALQATGNALLDLSAKTGQSTHDMTAAFYDLLSAGIGVTSQGVDVADTNLALKAATDLAIGGLSSETEAVKLLSFSLNTYGESADKAQGQANIFAKAVEVGVVTASQIATSFSTVAQNAKIANIGLDEIGATYGYLTRVGFTASRATTSMNRAIVELQKPHKALLDLQEKTNTNYLKLAGDTTLANALQQMRIDAANAGISFTSLFGRQEAFRFAASVTNDVVKQGTKYVAAATGGNTEYNKTLKEIQGSSEGVGTAQEQAARRGDTLSRNIVKLKDSFYALSVAVGTPLLTPLNNFVKSMSVTIQGMTRWSRAHEELIKTWAPILGLIGGLLALTAGTQGLLFVLTPLAPMLGTTGTALRGLVIVVQRFLLPIALIIVAMTAFRAAVASNFAGFGRFKSDLGDMNKVINGAVGFIQALIRAFQRLLAGTDMSSIFQGLKGGIDTAMNGVLPALQRFVSFTIARGRDLVAYLGSMLPTIAAVLLRIAGAIFDWAVDIAPSIFGGIRDAVGTVIGWISNLVPQIGPALGVVINAVTTFIDAHGNEILTSLLTWTRQFAAWAISVATAIVTQAAQIIGGLVTWIQSADVLGKIGTALGDWTNKFVNWIMNAWPAIEAGATNLIDGFTKWMQDTKIISQIVQTLTNWSAALITGVTAAIAGLAHWLIFGGGAAAIFNAFTTAASQAVSGFVDGLNDIKNKLGPLGLAIDTVLTVAVIALALQLGNAVLSMGILIGQTTLSGIAGLATALKGLSISGLINDLKSLPGKLTGSGGAGGGSPAPSIGQGMTPGNPLYVFVTNEGFGKPPTGAPGGAPGEGAGGEGGGKVGEGAPEGGFRLRAIPESFGNFASNNPETLIFLASLAAALSQVDFIQKANAATTKMHEAAYRDYQLQLDKLSNDYHSGVIPTLEAYQAASADASTADALREKSIDDIVRGLGNYSTNVTAVSTQVSGAVKTMAEDTVVSAGSAGFAFRDFNQHVSASADEIANRWVPSISTATQKIAEDSITNTTRMATGVTAKTRTMAEDSVTNATRMSSGVVIESENMSTRNFKVTSGMVTRVGTEFNRMTTSARNAAKNTAAAIVNGVGAAAAGAGYNANVVALSVIENLAKIPAAAAQIGAAARKALEAGLTGEDATFFGQQGASALGLVRQVMNKIPKIINLPTGGAGGGGGGTTDTGGGGGGGGSGGGGGGTAKTPLEKALEVAKNAADLAEALQKIAGLDIGEMVRTSMGKIAKAMLLADQITFDIAKNFSKDKLQRVADFSDATSKVASLISTAADAFDKVADFKPITRQKLAALATDIKYAVQVVATVSSDFSDKSIAAASIFADSADKVISLVGSAYDAFGKIGNFQHHPKETFNQIAIDIQEAISSLAHTAVEVNPKQINLAQNFATSADKVVTFIGSAYDAFSKIGVYKDIAKATFNMLASDIQEAIASVAHIAKLLKPTAVSLASTFSDGATKVVSLIGTSYDAFSKIGDYSDVATEIFMGIGLDVADAVNAISAAATKVGTDGAANAATFADSASKVVSLVGTAFDTFSKIDDVVLIDPEMFNRIKSNIANSIIALNDAAIQVGQPMADAAGKFGEAATKVVGAIGAAVDAFSKIGDYAGVSPESITRLGADISATVTQMAIEAGKFKDPAVLKAVGDFSSSVSTIMGAIKATFDAFAPRVQEALTPTQTFIAPDLGAIHDQIDATLTQFTDLANKFPKEATDKIARLASAASAVASAIQAFFQLADSAGKGSTDPNNVSGQPQNFSQAIAGQISTILSALSAFQDDVYHIGEGLVTNLVKGMRLHEGDVTDVAQEIARILAAFLQAHSPTEVGPLSEDGGIGGWGRNIIIQMAEGMASAFPYLHKTLEQGLSGALQPWRELTSGNSLKPADIPNMFMRAGSGTNKSSGSSAGWSAADDARLGIYSESGHPQDFQMNQGVPGVSYGSYVDANGRQQFGWYKWETNSSNGVTNTVPVATDAPDQSEVYVGNREVPTQSSGQHVDASVHIHPGAFSGALFMGTEAEADRFVRTQIIPRTQRQQNRSLLTPGS